MKTLFLTVLGALIGLVLCGITFLASVLLIVIVSDVRDGSAGWMHYTTLILGASMFVLSSIRYTLKEAEYYGTDEKVPK
ncbi:hypothetical protein ACFOQM_23510 [Paenibacillus sp. GCM10012307]|uniref:Uncharacterized protein n=1 Tax=Paenibacillus roseus TaxID=2798579 RepID=A0A934JBP2_9BACL|nr:hypothetical protein [Paenibacillus roseus]MBJ6364191.1 hypothetical protein [Paenibacillus roseus]